MILFLHVANSLYSVFDAHWLKDLKIDWERVVFGSGDQSDIFIKYSIKIVRTEEWQPIGSLFVSIKGDSSINEDDEVCIAHLVKNKWELTPEGVAHNEYLLQWEEEKEGDDE
jgi:hypothetical protein